jgi:hypothetical protein
MTTHLAVVGRALRPPIPEFGGDKPRPTIRSDIRRQDGLSLGGAARRIFIVRPGDRRE